MMPGTYAQLLDAMCEVTLNEPRDVFLRPEVTQAAIRLAQLLAQRLGVEYIHAYGPSGPPREVTQEARSRRP